VLGAGPAGLAAAIGIRREAHASVLVIDAGLASRERVGEGATPEILVPLAQLGLLDEFRSSAHAACPGSASIWEGTGVGCNDYILSPMGPAWRLHRRAFDDMLARAAREAGAELCWGVRYCSSQQDQEGHRLRLRTPAAPYNIRARYVVDATGPTARFGVHAGARRSVEDRMCALARYATIRAGQMTLQTLLEAVDDGWWYAARLPDDRVVVLFAGESGAVRRIQGARADGFERALAQTTLIGPILENLMIDGPVYLSAPI
jgi:flavin-dependent dehydrogenase